MTPRLVLAGDVMTGRGIDQVLPHPGAPRLLESWVRDAREYVRLAEQAHGPIPVPVPPAYVWGDALAEMDRFGPALRIVNLETAVTRSEAAWPGKGIHYRMDPRNVDCLTAARLAEQAHGPIPVPVPPAYVWGDALAEMERFGPALRIVNLETAVTRSEAAWPGKGIHYRMDPRNVDCLTAARLDGCSLANNHVLDWGRAGLRETLSTLAEAGLASAGAGLDLQQASAPAALPWADGGRVLLSAWATPSSGVPEGWAAGRDRSGVALLPELTERSAAAVARTVERVRRPGDVAVVSLHWGGNWGFELPPAHRTFARRLIDLGAADVVHGHSSHHALPIEVYRGRAILYGCGDLLNDYEGIGPHGSLRSDLACLYLLSLAADGRLEALEIAPLQLRRFRLEQADPQARDWLERVFLEQGRPLGTRIETTSQGRFALRWD